MKELAARIQDNIRKSDFHAHCGGEEFVILVPGVDKEKAGVTKRIHPHLFRHQLLTYLTGKGIMEPTSNLSVSISTVGFSGATKK